MNKYLCNNILIIGAGLIGSSIARGIKEYNISSEIYGIDTNDKVISKCKELKILNDIIDAAPTDGLWDDGRTDEGQLGLKYEELEEAMNNQDSQNRQKYEKIRKLNLHKMVPIPVCKIPK
jgi:NH3-dependent NAD+ synthetase